jgi:hypothetical protein
MIEEDTMWVQHFAWNFPEENSTDNGDNKSGIASECVDKTECEPESANCVVHTVVSELSLKPDNSDKAGQRARRN